jgi:hypothetical protein
MSLTLSPTHRENGNIFFIILVAVALFAALSFAISQGMRGSSASVSKEQSQLYASELITFAKSLESAVQRLQARGVSENDLCFDIDDYPGGDTMYEHASCANTRNRVFHPDGGGIFYKAFTGQDGFSIASERINGGNKVENVGTTCGPAACTELLYVVRMNDTAEGSLEICNAINAELGIVASAPPIDTAINTAHAFTGTFNATAAGTTIADSGQAPELLGKKTGCIQETTGGGDDYVFYHVLIAR